MALKGFDFKAFGLKYGERIGLGVGVSLMALLVLWGVLGGGAEITRDAIAKNAARADQAIKTSPVVDSELFPAGIITPGQLDKLAIAVQKYIGIETIRTVWPYFVVLPGEDHFLKNPDVFVADQLIAEPVQFAFKIIDVRNGKVLTAENPKDNKFEQKDKRDHKKRIQGAGRGGYPGGYGSGPGGVGGGAGGLGGGAGGLGGGPGGATGPAGPGGIGGGAGRGPGGAGGKASGLGGGAGSGAIGGAGDGLGMPGAGQQDLWLARWIDLDKFDNQILAHNLWPARATLILASYPHGQQMEAIAKALKLGDQANAPILYREPQAQRREVILKGTRMADGTVIAEDMVRMPVDRSLKPLAQLPQNPVTDADIEKAGWITINTGARSPIAWLLGTAVEFEEETDPALRAIKEQVDRLMMKLPKAQRGTYPDFAKKLTRIKETIDKINEKGKPPPRRRDPRLPTDEFDPFGSSSSDKAASNEGGAGTLGGGAGTLGGAGPGRPPGYPPGAPPGYPSGTGGRGAGGAVLGGGGSGREGAAGPGSGAGVLGGTGGGTTGGSSSLAGDDFKDMAGLIRFLDLDLNTIEAAGKTYEYRIRVVLQNPNYQREDVVENPEYAKEKELKGPWSAVTRVTFPEEAYVYPDERVRESKTGTGPDMALLDRVPVQVHKWLSVVTSRGVVTDERVGEWWVDRILAARGEYFGLNRMPNPLPPAAAGQGKPDPALVSLIVWVATSPDPDKANTMGTDALKPEARTDSLATRHLLVDFDGGYRISKRTPGKRNYEEDVPAEILVVEPNGRMFARALNKDKESPSRKRYETWNEWFKAVKDRYESKRPKDGNSKKGDSTRPDL